MIPRVYHEADKAQCILVSAPHESSEFGTYHYEGSLFDNPLDYSASREGHKTFTDTLISNIEQTINYKLIPFSSNVVDIIEVLKCRDKNELIELATDNLHYAQDVPDNKYSADYKRKTLQFLSHESLVNIIITRPIVHLKKTEKNTKIEVQNYELKPLTNLTFVRDQQITTFNGITLGRMASEVRRYETNIMKTFFEKHGIKIKCEIKAPGLLEGGDFIPMGNVSLIGTGLRTNKEAVFQMMKTDAFGTEFVAVVKDRNDKQQQRMHLDTVFNVVSYDCVMILENIRCRVVDLYKQSSNGFYRLRESNIDFRYFLEDRMKLQCIEITDEMQACFAINFLNIGLNRLICTTSNNKDVDMYIKTMLENKGVQVFQVDFKDVTNMGGGPHCSSQVILREIPENRMTYII
jgi:arginine deiminase